MAVAVDHDGVPMTGRGDADFWLSRWETGKTGWHMDFVTKWLSDNLHQLTQGKDRIRIFLPLCGKSLDLMWLVDQGHEVVGVELSPKAIKEVFKDIAHTVTPMEVCDGDVYKSSDGNLTLYRCDMFLLNRDNVGTFDAMWDRGSLVALPKDIRAKYSELMMSLMKPDCRYVLERMVYDCITGPPHVIKEEEVKELYGSRCNIVCLHSEDSELGQKFFKVPSFLFFYELITLR